MTLSLMISAAMFSRREYRYDPAADDDAQDEWYVSLIVSVNDMLFILSHWVFVYYYLKVAFTISIYFDSLSEPKQAKEKEKRTRTILTICSVCFIITTIVLYSL